MLILLCKLMSVKLFFYYIIYIYKKILLFLLLFLLLLTSGLCYTFLIHLWCVRCMIIQLPRTCRTYNFLCGFQAAFFKRCFCRQRYSRKVAGLFQEETHKRGECKYFNSYWDRTRNLWHDRPVHCLSRSRFIKNIVKHRN